MGTFTRFSDDDIVKANPTEVTFGIWSGETGSLSSFYTGPQSASVSGQYYWNVYNINPTSSLAEVQFSVAYGHRTGGGNSSLLVDQNATLSTLATYMQYRNLLLEPDDAQFTFAGDYNTDQIYVINIARGRMKEKLDPGNWQIKLTGASGSFTFIDDSGQTLGANWGRAGEVFNVVSGSLSGSMQASASAGFTIAATGSAGFGGFGLVYPSLGLILLNPDAISKTIGMVAGGYGAGLPFAPVTSSTATQYNHVGLLNAIKTGSSFIARSAENISSTHYFVRLRNKEYNYTNNPSFFTATNGLILNTDFIQNPRVYVTTIGLYNDNNELLAVAKTSQPIQKSFDKELLLRVRLDW
jgi:hypothetical protein